MPGKNGNYLMHASVFAFLYLLVADYCVAAQTTWHDLNKRCPLLADHVQPRREPIDVAYAAQLAEEIRAADAGQGYDLIFYGDSITEQWRETDQSRPTVRALGDFKLFKKYFGRYRASVMAVGGDQVAHLQWRLLHGEIPVRHHPKLVVVMIGTNDLGVVSGCVHYNTTGITEAAPGVIHRLAFTIELLQDRLPHTNVLLLGLTPRGNDFTPKGAWVWPSIFTPAIKEVNTWLRKQAVIRPGVHYLDCSPDLLVNGTVTPAMFVDGIHPSHAAMDKLGKCISRAVDSIMGQKRSSVSVRLQLTGHVG